MRNLILLTLALTLLTPAFADEGHHHDAGIADYGSVRFPTSCSPAVQTDFERAVAMLHSFGYERANRAFREVAERDPQCAIAWWGVAMTQYHGLWEQVSLPEGQAAIAKARAIAKANPKTTAHERAYVEAIAQIFDDPATPLHDRELAYERALAKLRATYPDDREAAIFYALALDVDAPKTDKSYANQRKARDILVPIFQREPKHPGLAHYIIHVSDYPPLAAEALDAARRYAQIAPASAHAQHMPSHIFTRLGLWEESIGSNRASAASAERDQKAGQGTEAYNQRLHALDYLEYAYLQQRRLGEARAVVELARQIRATQALNNTGGYAEAAIPARFALEQRRWAEAAALPVNTANPSTQALTWFARGIGAARSSNAAGAAEAARKLSALHDALVAANNPYWASQVEVQRLAVLAWQAHARGDSERALEQMRAAAAMEDSTDKAPVTPGALLPARELLGDMLLATGDAKTALAEFEASLKVAPNRYNAIAGAAQAAQSVDPAKAKFYAGKLEELKKAATVGGGG